MSCFDFDQFLVFLVLVSYSRLWSGLELKRAPLRNLNFARRNQVWLWSLVCFISNRQTDPFWTFHFWGLCSAFSRLSSFVQRGWKQVRDFRFHCHDVYPTFNPRPKWTKQQLNFNLIKNHGGNDHEASYYAFLHMYRVRLANFGFETQILSL